MPAPLSGPGLGLPLPQNLYPSELSNAPYDTPTNTIALAPGDELPVPAGNWYIGLGSYLVLEFLDPVNGTWTLIPASAWNGACAYVKSDGFNLRIANRTGTPVSATITNQGSGYAQATSSITVAGGTSTWVPLIGGALTASISNNGAGYGVAPIVFIPAPPGPANNANGVGGIQATAWASIANGTVNGVTMLNQGAGYPSNLTVTLFPNPTDPNLVTGITNATVVFTLTQSGSLTGALLTNPGVALSNPANITLTLAGAGTNGSLTANVMQTVTAGSVAGGATGPYGTVAALLTTTGGNPGTGTITASYNKNLLAWRPRQAQINLTVTGTNSIAPQVGTIIDGGLFLAAPNPVIVVNPAVAQSGSIAGGLTVALTMGSVNDYATLQPAP